MIIDVILGSNIDTLDWIVNLKRDGCEFIIVVDYDYYGDPKVVDDTIFFSALDAKNYIKKFDSANYYKSMYCYPEILMKKRTFKKKKEDQ